MGFFGLFLGWDQSMGAVNAVLGSHLIEKTDAGTRKKISKEVADIVMRVRQRQQLEAILDEITTKNRVVQMNFVALACDNLGIDPPVRNNVWTRVKNPYLIGSQVDATRISLAVQAIEKQDGVRVVWPGNDVRVDFKKMYEHGTV